MAAPSTSTATTRRWAHCRVRAAPSLLGSGTLTAGDASNTALAAAISGSGGFVKQGSGTLTLTGASNFTGGTTLNAGVLVVNGSLTSGVTVNGGMLRGTGTVGNVVANGGVVAPGNSIGTLTVSGNFVQSGGSIYQVEVNAAGQNDRINVAGTATISGATVQVLAQSGSYARNTTYTILNATGGVSGTYSGVTSNFAFLTPTLTYDANNVFLNLFQSSSAFAAGAQTPNQYAVGMALDQANPTATGDFGTVLNAMSVLSTQQGPAALNAISGQQYADFGTMNVQSGVLFMNAVGQQMALARGSATGGGQRQALAQACEVESCDAGEPVGRLGERAGRAGQRRRQRQLLDADLQFRRRRGRHRLSPRPALSRRHRRGLRRGQPVGRQLHGPRLDRQRQRHGLWLLHSGAASMPTRWRATPIPATRCSARS